jgi:hypothetical protein
MVPRHEQSHAPPLPSTIDPAHLYVFHFPAPKGKEELNPLHLLQSRLAAQGFAVTTKDLSEGMTDAGSLFEITFSRADCSGTILRPYCQETGLRFHNVFNRWSCKRAWDYRDSVLSVGQGCVL